tara:strand:- start:63 stop:815 length:753 start_codon:yes stop_codon:yes gene_type:complete
MINWTIYTLKKIIRIITGKEKFEGTFAYRKYLFQEVVDYYGKDYFSNKRFLEIGPKDGEDTKRLYSLNPKDYVLFDLPDKETENKKFKDILKEGHELIIKNFLYLDKKEYNDLGTFDLIYFTGVLYHNPEQLRFIKKLYDKLNSGGVLVLESATIRNSLYKKKNVVQIWYPETYRNTTTITHLPSKGAIKSWLNMVGFSNVIDSSCYDPENYNVRNNRYACFAQKKENDKEAVYYEKQIQNSNFKIGGST